MKKLSIIHFLLFIVLCCSCASFHSKLQKSECTSREAQIEVSSSLYFDSFVKKREFDYIPKKDIKRSPWWDYYYRSFDQSLRHIDGIKDVYFVSVDEPIRLNKRFHMMFYFNDDKTTFDQAMYYINNITLGIVPFFKKFRGRLKVDTLNKNNEVISSHEFISDYDYYRSILLLPIGPFFPREHADIALRNDLVNKMAQSFFCE